MGVWILSRGPCGQRLVSEHHLFSAQYRDPYQNRKNTVRTKRVPFQWWLHKCKPFWHYTALFTCVECMGLVSVYEIPLCRFILCKRFQCPFLGLNSLFSSFISSSFPLSLNHLCFSSFFYLNLFFSWVEVMCKKRRLTSLGATCSQLKNLWQKMSTLMPYCIMLWWYQAFLQPLIPSPLATEAHLNNW